MGGQNLHPDVELALETFNDHDLPAHMEPFADGATFVDAVSLVSIIEVSDDGITSWRDYWDQQTFREQLGLTFPVVLVHLPRWTRSALDEAR